TPAVPKTSDPPAALPSPPSKAVEPRAAMPPGFEVKQAPVPLHRVHRAQPLAVVAAVEAPAVEPKAAAAPDASPAMNEAVARTAIERDGYKGVRNLAFANGRWSARAMRGRTEIGVSVDAGGNVSAD